MSANVRARILAEIEAERARQDARWGEQNHPDVWPRTQWYETVTTDAMARHYGVPEAAEAKARCDRSAWCGTCTWAHILVEEVAEVIEAATMAEHLRGSEHQHAEEDVDRELVQLAAVCVSWLEARSRRRAGGEL